MQFHSFLLSALLATAASAVPVILNERDASPAKLNKFQFVGMNEAGPEFGEKNFPGTKGKDYTWLNNTSMKIFMDKGMNTFRINFLMERLIENQMTGKLNQQYFADLKDVSSCGTVR